MHRRAAPSRKLVSLKFLADAKAWSRSRLMCLKQVCQHGHILTLLLACRSHYFLPIDADRFCALEWGSEHFIIWGNLHLRQLGANVACREPRCSYMSRWLHLNVAQPGCPFRYSDMARTTESVSPRCGLLL